MGSFVFKWEHPASQDVFVTGTFDEWRKTEQLEKVDRHFEKTVTLSDVSSKIYYKDELLESATYCFGVSASSYDAGGRKTKTFVVDGNWVVDHTAPKEVDESGNENNVLEVENITMTAPNTIPTLNSVGAGSTTAVLAGGVPLEKDKKEDSKAPGSFPDTPAGLESEKNKPFSVNPLPATEGFGNPIQLAPGEKIPEHLAQGDTTSHVKLDKESYENGNSAGAASAFISSVGPGSTTAALAATAPLENQVPQVVKDSQEKAHVDPEASAVPAEVEVKSAAEQELKDKIQEAPTTSEGTAGKGTEKMENAVTPGEAAASIAAALTAVGGVAVAGAVAAKDTATERLVETAAQLPESVKNQLPESLQTAITTSSKEHNLETVSPKVPTEVKDSIAEAGRSPEAAANTEAVQDKKLVESQLLKHVKEEPAVDDKAISKTKEDDTGSTSTPAAVVDKVAHKVEESTAATKAKLEESVLAASTPTPEKQKATSEPEAQSLATPPNGASSAKAETKTDNTAKKVDEPASAKPLPAPIATNGSSPTKAPESPSTANGTPDKERKKKNRLSSVFNKLRGKISHNKEKSQSEN